MPASSLNSKRTAEADCENNHQFLVEQLERQQALLQSLLGQIDVLIYADNEHQLLEVICTQLLASGLFVSAWFGRMASPQAEQFEVLAVGSNGCDVLDALNDAQRAVFRKYLARAQYQEEIIIGHQGVDQPENLEDTRKRTRKENQDIEDAEHALLTDPWKSFMPQGASSSIFFIPVKRHEMPWTVLVVIAPHERPLEKLIPGTLKRLAVLLSHSIAQLDLRQRLSNEHEKTAYLAYHDALTGLANRRFLDEELPKALARAKRNGQSLAVVMLDLDDFKPINDHYGHAAGDELLKTLAQRIRQVLRAGDLAVRQGGDEFILLIEGIECKNDLIKSLKRIDRALSKPYQLPKGSSQLQASMGVTVFPQDDVEPDLLIRHADAALYASKDHKHDRKHAWRFWNQNHTDDDKDAPDETLNPIERISPYGAEANNLLEKLSSEIDQTTTQFVDQFYQELIATDPASAALLKLLTANEYAHLKNQQTEHLRFLFSPDLSESGHRTRARMVGKIHALMGVSPSSIVRAMTIYMHQFNDSALGYALGRQDALKLETLITERLNIELSEQLEAEQDVDKLFQSILHDINILSRQTASWQEFNEQLLDKLCQPDAIKAGWIGAPGDEGRFVINFGHYKPEVSRVLTESEDPIALPTILEHHTDFHGATGLAFRTGQIQTIDSFIQHEKTKMWRQLAEKTGVRSSVSIPIMDAKRHPVAVLTLYGGYPGMFETMHRKSFISQVGFIVSQTWQQLNHTQGLNLSIQQIDRWRQAFYNNGIRFVYQPIFDLHTGQMVKVEALARLDLPNGETIMPGLFISRLNPSQIIDLFKKGLDTCLAQLALWDRQWRQSDTGTALKLSLNLPLEALIHADCAQWVTEALNRHGLSAARLELEVLEQEEIDEFEHSAQQMRQLARLGVGLTMDDLGAGYSNLIRLNHLPFDTVKIDRALIRSAYTDPPRIIKFISALTHMTHALNLNVVAEGLEHPDLVEAARILGADMGQGYALSRPLEPDALTSWIQAYTSPQIPSYPQTAMGAIATHLQWVSRHQAPENNNGQRNEQNHNHTQAGSQSEFQDQGHDHRVDRDHYTDCPLHQFIVNQELEGSALDAAHQALHATQMSNNAHTHYLLTQVQSLLAELVSKPTLEGDGEDNPNDRYRINTTREAQQ